MGQNLIPNASFETSVDFNQDSENNQWHKYFEYHSPDYFNFSPENESNNVFDKYIGGVSPKDGQAFVGIFCYRVNERKNIKDIREYIETSLTETLKKDSLYEFSFYLCLDSESNIAIKNFGVLFTTKPNAYNKEYKTFRSNPQIVFDSILLENSTNWIRLNAKYLAKGYENYIVIGNFNTDKNTDIKAIIIDWKTNKKEKWNLERNELAAYYYLDNLELINVINPNPRIAIKKDSVDFIDIESIKIDSSIVLSNVNFVFNTSTLLEESFPELLRLLEIMDTRPNMKIKIIGHTDNIGTPEYNNDLSIERSLSVRQFLIENGVAENRIEYEGLGLTKPILDNKTEEARKINRRVEFKIISK